MATAQKCFRGRHRLTTPMLPQIGQCMKVAISRTVATYTDFNKWEIIFKINEWNATV
jgi:hypothetical protein